MLLELPHGFFARVGSAGPIADVRLKSREAPPPISSVPVHRAMRLSDGPDQLAAFGADVKGFAPVDVGFRDVEEEGHRVRLGLGQAVAVWH